MDEEAKLLVVKNAKDKDGFAEESITEEYPVYVTEKSATRSEYYAALQAGIQIKLVLEMRLGRLGTDCAPIGKQKGICYTAGI